MNKLESESCFYCGALVSFSGGNGDHFPIPKRNGGVDTVPCCLSCHDMKDRYTVGQWPIEWVSGVVANDFPNMSREGKLLFAKMLSVFSDSTKRATK